MDPHPTPATWSLRQSLAGLWGRIRAWRRIRFTSGGAAFSLGAMAVGFAAMNTGNNLLYLLLGSMLGFIAVSGWLSEQAIRALHIERRSPRTVTLSTGFPFGMFRKERDVEIPGEVVVWPRTDRPVRDPNPGAGRIPRTGVSARGAAGTRGEYRSLRTYRIGDDSRDIHWRSSARLREPVIRQYERDGAETRWICLDLRTEPGESAEVAVEVAASLAETAMAQQRPFALVAGQDVLEPGDGAGQLERALDLLARVDFSEDAPAPAPPVATEQCVLVCVAARGGFGDVIAVGADARLRHAEEDAA